MEGWAAAAALPAAHRALASEAASLRTSLTTNHPAPSRQNELATLELIHCCVETLDKWFSNVCELDIMFALDTTHHILDEMVRAGGTCWACPSPQAAVRAVMCGPRARRWGGLACACTQLPLPVANLLPHSARPPPSSNAGGQRVRGGDKQGDGAHARAAAGAAHVAAAG